MHLQQEGLSKWATNVMQLVQEGMGALDHLLVSHSLRLLRLQAANPKSHHFSTF